MPAKSISVLIRRARTTVVCRLCRVFLFVSVSAFAASILGSAAHAAEIRLLSAAAMQSVFKDIVEDFERTTGHNLIINYGTIGAITQRIQAGEVADVVIGSNLSMPSLVKDGKIDPGSVIAICKTAIGAVVSPGSAKPNITTVENFKQTLLDAKVVIYADPVRGGAAGIHIARVIETLGLTEQLKTKIKLAAGGDITEVTVASGEGAFGMTQVSEIVQKPGATYVGQLPAELQNYTVFVGGIPAGTTPSEAVRTFFSYLKGPTAMAAIAAKGMQAD